MRVLVTRPQAEALATRSRLVALGHEAVVDPMLTITALPGAWPPGRFDAVVVTSGNAVAATAGRPEAAGLLSLPLAAVGRRTAAAARQAGFLNVTSTGRDVAALAAHVAAEWTQPRRILYLAGSDRASDLAALLGPLGHDVTVAVVYEARKATGFGPGIEDALKSGGIDAVLHYSARTAEAFIACCGGGPGIASLAVGHVCLSRKVAGILEAAGVREVAVAERPEEDALLSLLPS